MNMLLGFFLVKVCVIKLTHNQLGSFNSRKCVITYTHGLNVLLHHFTSHFLPIGYVQINAEQLDQLRLT